MATNSGQQPVVEYARTDIGDTRNPWTMHCQFCNTYYHGSSQHHVHEWLAVHETGRDLSGRIVGFQDAPHCKELQRLADEDRHRDAVLFDPASTLDQRRADLHRRIAAVLQGVDNGHG